MITTENLHKGKAPAAEKFVLCAFKKGSGVECCSRWSTFSVGCYNHSAWYKLMIGWMSLKNLPRLRTGLPKQQWRKDGSVNCVLAKRSKPVREDLKDHLSIWQPSNTEYYHLHPDEYKGYIELEFLD